MTATRTPRRSMSIPRASVSIICITWREMFGNGYLIGIRSIPAGTRSAPHITSPRRPIASSAAVHGTARSTCCVPPTATRSGQRILIVTSGSAVRWTRPRSPCPTPTILSKSSLRQAQPVRLGIGNPPGYVKECTPFSIYNRSHKSG